MTEPGVESLVLRGLKGDGGDMDGRTIFQCVSQPSS
jgi:hypothetical protein